MTEENKASNDLVNSKIEIVPGVFIDDRMRIGGMMFLEERTGKEFFEIVNLLCTKRTTIDIYNIFLALVIQANENMDIKEAEKITRQSSSRKSILFWKGCEFSASHQKT